MMVRRVPRTVCAASFLLLVATAPAWAQFDMDPYRPYNEGFRSFTFPDENTKYGAGRPAPLFVAPRPSYRLQTFEERVARDLDADGLLGTPPAGERGNGGGGSAFAGGSDPIASSRKLRDRYYFAALKESDPQRRTELMEGYRKESRKLEGLLAGSRAAAPSRARPRPAATTAPASRTPSPSTAAAAAVASPRPSPSPSTLTPAGRTTPRTPPAATAPASATPR